MNAPDKIVRNIFIVCGVLIALAILGSLFRKGSPTPVPAGPTGIRYLAIDATCAPSKSAASDMLRAVREKDLEAIQGLIDRGQIFAVTAGTRFEVSDYRTAPFAWGFVRSGRETGRDCYLPSMALR